MFFWIDPLSQITASYVPENWRWGALVCSYLNLGAGEAMAVGLVLSSRHRK